jgi:glucosamine--fructose-6-phosphate aminotransferase (isomerizing)
MCGIFGYVGPRATKTLLLEGLKRLEYRGYDSWGIGLGTEAAETIHSNAIHVVKESGRIAAGTFAGEESIQSFWGGIAHTRWATHGAPTKVNAHPHLAADGRIAIVHNGIVENHRSLKTSLEAKGCTFASETDSEVIGHLIGDLMREGIDFEDAFLGTLRLLEGTYGIAAIHADRPGLILAGRKGSPMVLGIGDKEVMIASDPSALVAHTRNVVYLEDGEIAVLRPEGFETKDLDAVQITKQIEKVAFDLPSIEKGGYAHFMLKEIFEQPETIRNAFRGRIIRNEGTAKLGGLDEELLRRTQRCHIIACGTSWHAGLIGKYLMENLARLPTQVSYAAEFRYANPVIEGDTLVIAISQSGETADTLSAVREARLRGGHTVGICNVVGSTIARECMQGVYLHAGPEIGVASTKAFTSQLVVLSLLAVHMGRMRDMSLADALYYLNALEELPALGQRVLDSNPEIKAIAAHYSKHPNFLYVGRLYEYPVALEGALKLKEISYVHAEGIPAAELKHGPIALVDRDTPTVVSAAGRSVIEKITANIQEIKARGGPIIAITSEGNDEIESLADHTIFIPRTLDALLPIISVIPLQLLAYHIAVERGCDVDKPRNLAKSVTVE